MIEDIFVIVTSVYCLLIEGYIRAAMLIRLSVYDIVIAFSTIRCIWRLSALKATTKKEAATNTEPITVVVAILLAVLGISAVAMHIIY